MSSLESNPGEDLASLSSTSVQAELAHWERLIFSFDMDNESGNASNDRHLRDSRRSRSRSAVAPAHAPSSNRPEAQDAALLAQFAAISALPPSSSSDSYEALAVALRAAQGGGYPSFSVPPGFPPNYFNPGPMGHPQLSPLPPPNFPWPQPPPQYPVQNPYNSQHQGSSYNPGMMPYTYGGSSYAQLPPIDTRNHTLMRSSAPDPTPSASAASPEGAESDEEPAPSNEDKRRRNTAASARFRIKKKQRTLNLERSVLDLTGRADELEREAADLRRENGWLKEIVMLKGSRLGGFRSIQPHQSAEGSGQNPREGGANPGPSRKTAQPNDSGPTDSSSDEGDSVANSKGNSKGKAKAKGPRNPR